MTRIGIALAVGTVGLLFTAPAQAQAPVTSSTPFVTGGQIMAGPGPVMTTDGYSGTTRRGLFGRLRGRTSYSGQPTYSGQPIYSGQPVYSSPYPGTTSPVIVSPGTTTPVPMPGTTIPSQMPSSRPANGSTTLGTPQIIQGTTSSSSLYPQGTIIATDGTVIPAPGTVIQPGTTIINGTVIPAGGTITTTDGTVIPASGTIISTDGTMLSSGYGMPMTYGMPMGYTMPGSYSMPTSYYMPSGYSTMSQPVRRGLFGRLRNR